MAVLLETSLGELTIDLFIDEVPVLAANFLKLCKYKFYNNSLFHSVEKDFIARAGLPYHAASEQGDASSQSILSLVKDKNRKTYDSIVDGSCEEKFYTKARFDHATGYLHECFHPKLCHQARGTVSMANDTPNAIGSSFFITLRDSIDYLDNRRSIIGTVAEGLEVLDALNKTLVEDKVSNKPLLAIRILHTVVLDDPFPDPPGLFTGTPVSSPLPIKDNVTEDDIKESTANDTVEKEIAAFERIARSEAKSRAVALEILGDLPDADLAPPENVLFICKLNPVTEAADLELIFSRFGKILSCEIIRDWKTGDSLQYGFIEFEDPKACEAALFKLEGCLIDDRRIHVDFCQSVSKQWAAFRRFGPRQMREPNAEGAVIPAVHSNHSTRHATPAQSKFGYLFDASPDNNHPPHTSRASISAARPLKRREPLLDTASPSPRSSKIRTINDDKVRRTDRKHAERYEASEPRDRAAARRRSRSGSYTRRHDSQQSVPRRGQENDRYKRRTAWEDSPSRPRYNYQRH